MATRPAVNPCMWSATFKAFVMTEPGGIAGFSIWKRPHCSEGCKHVIQSQQSRVHTNRTFTHELGMKFVQEPI